MDFALTADQELFRGAIREFATAVLAPAAAAADEAGAFPPDVLAQTAALGLFGMLIPEAHGGAAVGPLRFALALEEIARASAALAARLNAHNTLAALPLVLAGTPTQQARWLPALARGDMFGAGFLPADSAPTSPAVPTLQATESGNGWCLDGTAPWVPNGADATLYVVFAPTQLAAPGDRAAYLLPAETAGLHVSAPVETVGLRGAAIVDLALTACDLPADARLGSPEPDAHRAGAHAELAASVCDLALVGTAAQALGIAQASLDAAVAYAQERQQFGRPIAHFEGLRHLLADVALAVDAARLLVYRAAWLSERGLPAAKAAAMAKLHAGDTAMLAATKAIQVHGGYGYMRESPVQRYFRDAKVTQATHGPALHQRTAIADALLPPLP